MRTDHNGAPAIFAAGTEYRYHETYSSAVYGDGRRVAGLTYPSGRQVNFTYGATNSFDDRLHRLAGLTSNLKAGGTHNCR